MSDSPGLVDFAIELVISVLKLPDRQIKFTYMYRKTVINPVHQNDSIGPVHANCNLPKWQAVKLTFFAPCTMGIFDEHEHFLMLKNSVFGKYQVHIAVEGACMAPPSVNPFPELLILWMSWCIHDFVFSFQLQQFVERGQLNWAVEQLTVLSELAKLLSDSRCCNLTKFVKEMHLHWQKILLNKLAR